MFYNKNIIMLDELFVWVLAFFWTIIIRTMPTIPFRSNVHSDRLTKSIVLHPFSERSSRNQPMDSIGFARVSTAIPHSKPWVDFWCNYGNLR